MALNKGISKAVAALFVVMLLGLAMESVKVEGKICQKPSGKFKGPCLSTSKCVKTCKSEGNPAGGSCVTKDGEGVLKAKCLCKYPC